MTSYTCRKCKLVFLPEETPHRFNSRQKLCARCSLFLRLKGKTSSLPSCFGKEFEGASLTCSSICTATEACLIQTIDNRSIQWSLDVDKKFAKHREMPLIQHAVRILRSAGHPLHLYDLAPILEKTTKKRFHMDPRMMWTQKINKSLCRCPDVISLGQGFYVWRGCWDPQQGGTIGYRNRYQEKKNKTPIKKTPPG